MAAEFQLAVVAPDREVFNEPVSGVVLPGEMGFLGILPRHEPCVVTLKAGTLSVTAAGSGQKRQVTIGGGFAEITAERVTILADSVQLND